MGLNYFCNVKNSADLNLSAEFNIHINKNWNVQPVINSGHQQKMIQDSFGRFKRIIKYFAIQAKYLQHLLYQTHNIF